MPQRRIIVWESCGGSKESSYNASFFYKDQKGIVKGGSSKLLGGSFNFDASVREVIRFKLGLAGNIPCDE